MIVTADAYAAIGCAGFVLVLLLLVVDLEITGRLLIGKKLKPVELCSYTLARKRGDELMWSRVHNNSKARWGAVVFLVIFIGMMASK